jgi:SPP1 family phage portal protein
MKYGVTNVKDGLSLTLRREKLMANIKKIKIPVKESDFRTDEQVIEVVNKYLTDILSVHFINATFEQTYIDYYDGVQKILEKERKFKVDNEREISNNKIVENHAQAQVDFLTDYLMGEKLKFSSKDLDKLPVEKLFKMEGYLNDSGFYTEQREVAKDMFKLGVGVSYQNVNSAIVEKEDGKYKIKDEVKNGETSPFEITHLDPRYNFVVYSSYVKEEPLFAVNIVQLSDPITQAQDNATYFVLGLYAMTIYTKDGIYETNVEKRKDKDEVITYVPLNLNTTSFNKVDNVLGMLPIVEKTYNKERVGIIETNKGLYDLINLIDSNGGDAIYDNVNQVWVFENVSFDDETSLDDLIRNGAIQVSSTGMEGTNGKVYTLEVKYNQADVNILKQDVKNASYEIAGVPISTSNSSSGITGTAQRTSGGWENAEIKMNGRIIGMQKTDYSILKCLIKVCKIVLDNEFTNVNSNLIDISYKLSMSDNILSKCQSATNLYNINMPLELILKITRLSNDPSTDAKKWQDHINELDEKTFEKKVKELALEKEKQSQVQNGEQGDKDYAEQKREEQKKASEEKGINQKGQLDIKKSE